MSARKPKKIEQAMEQQAAKEKTEAERIQVLEREIAQLRGVLQRTAAAISREGAQLGTWGAELNKLLGL